MEKIKFIEIKTMNKIEICPVCSKVLCYIMMCSECSYSNDQDICTLKQKDECNCSEYEYYEYIKKQQTKINSLETQIYSLLFQRGLVIKRFDL